MKRLLLPLIAALALPTAASAETWYLFVGSEKTKSSSGFVSWQMPTESENQCNKAKAKVLDKENWDGDKGRLKVKAICLKGK